MPITRRGVYHNLKESKYTVSNSDIVFFFSSEHTLNKFMDGYRKQRENDNFYGELNGTPLNMDIVSDIEFYKKCEKRGFYVWLKGVSISYEELYQYALRLMSLKNSPEWKRIDRPKTVERFR